MLITVSGKKLRIKDCKYSSARGLMFDDMKTIDGALIHGNSIWMPFVRYNLYLLFLDKNFIVIDIQKAIPMKLHPKTWKVYRCKKAKYCLELRRNIIKAKKGMKIVIIVNP